MSNKWSVTSWMTKEKTRAFLYMKKISRSR